MFYVAMIVMVKDGDVSTYENTRTVELPAIPEIGTKIYDREHYGFTVTGVKMYVGVPMTTVEVLRMPD